MATAGTTGTSGTSTATSGSRAYRSVLGIPGVGALYAVALGARIPLTATTVVLTLHVALGMGRGFAAAGLVGGTVTLGIAVGAPLLGRLVDRRGLRPVLLLSAVAEAVFWGVAPLLDLAALVAASFVAGLLCVPAFSVVRQALVAAVPSDLRRPAFALDAMSAELSYIAGPGLGTAAALALPSSVSLRLVGAGFVVAAAVLWWLDPPTRDEPGTVRPGAAPPIRSWMTTPMVVALASAAAAILLLSATELGVVAALTARGETGWFALANAVWCGASLLGGFLHGATTRPYPLPVLLGALALGSAPVALGGPWWLVSLLLVPAGLFCAPALAVSAEAVGRLAPDAARGVANGLHGSAIMLGAAVAAPVSGLLIDRIGPAAAILGAVAVAAAVAAVAGLTTRRLPAPSAA